MTNAEHGNGSRTEGKQMSLFLSPIVTDPGQRHKEAKHRNARRPPQKECRECGRRVSSWKDGKLCGVCVRADRIKREKAASREALYIRAKVNVFPEGF